MGKKDDINQVDSIAREIGISGKVRKAFGRFLEQEKRNGYGATLNDRGDFTYSELRQKAKEFLEDIMTPKTSLANSILNLNQIIQPIIGETCHQIAFSYGDELLLDFGEMTAYDHPKLAHLRKGSWQLSTRATPWYLMLGNSIFIHSSMFANYQNAAELAKIPLQYLENKKLTNFALGGNHNFKLTLSFEDHYELVLEPDLEDDSGLAYWELMMPNEQILTVGPGMFWECKSIHEPY